VATDKILRTPTSVFADDDRPLADDVEKQLIVDFTVFEKFSMLTLLLITHC